ncbi:MAG: TlpA disulfide reductase family protein [Firmicutes bacterium]|nr:TlpA disulfide reductase family protein [Bacillota bacterium]
MNSKKKLLIILLIFVLLMGGASVLYTRLGQQIAPDQLSAQETQETQEQASVQGGDETDETQEQKTPAPDFVVYDAEGNEVKLSDFLGKPVVLNFWASWCGPCKMEMPEFHEKYLELGDEVQFLMINLTDGARETVDVAASFIESQEYTFPVLYDTKSSAAAAYGIRSIPTTFFIDADGCAIAQATGAISADTLQRGIDLIT